MGTMNKVIEDLLTIMELKGIVLTSLQHTALTKSQCRIKKTFCADGTIRYQITFPDGLVICVED